VVARHIAFVCALVLISLAQARGADAHASLTKAEPADGAVIAAPPAALTLTFNEAVSPLVVRLIGPDGEPILPPRTRPSPSPRDNACSAARTC
jgi:copper transport protein